MSVPAANEITIDMKAENWGFGDVIGEPREKESALLAPRPVSTNVK